MQPTTSTDHKKMFSELIKKQMLVLGPDITLAKVKNVPGLTVDQNGEVVSIEGDPQMLLQSLINQFVELSGMIVKKTMESILTSYPSMMGIAAGQMMGAAVSATPPSQTQSEGVPIPAVPMVAEKADSVVSVPPVASEPPKEPPSMASMNLDSLSQGPASAPQKKEPEHFSQSEMADLNKALEDLAKAPLSTETLAQQPQVAS